MRLRLLIVFFIALNLSCGGNILSEFGDPDSNEAKYYDARNALDDGDWTEAITIFEQMDASYLAKREIAISYAGAYLGRCGLDFFGAVEALAAVGVGTLFSTFMVELTSATASQADDCLSAEEIIRGISTDPADRTDDENLMIIFASLSKIGAILSLHGDTDNNGAVDGGFDPCSAGDMSDAYAAEVATGFTNARASLIEVIAAGTLNVDGLTATELNALCTFISGTLGPTYDFCDDYDAADITGDKQKAIRSIIKENQDVGIGPCVGDITTCNCP